jgi:hypothetical protein
MPEELPEAPAPARPEARKARPQAEPEAPSETVEQPEEVRPMFRRNKKKEEFETPRPVDRTNATAVNFYPNGDQYHGRKCLFHGENVVSVCPNCGTLFCMECVTHLDACPRCRLAINFVDGSKIAVDVDDRDVIETETQRKAIQQRWAMKRLAEADTHVREKDRETLMPDKDLQVERLMRDTNKRYNNPPVQEPPQQAYRAAAQKFEAPPADVSVEEAMAELEPAPEEILPEQHAPAPPVNKKADEKKEKLRELLDQEQGAQEESRDLSRL